LTLDVKKVPSLNAAIAAIQIAITAIFLVYSSWCDYKTREVTNKVWAIYAPIALALSLANFLIFEPSQLSSFALSVGVTIGFAFLLFYTSAFGGADSKAFMCIAMALPFFPANLITPILPLGLSPLAQTLFPLTILSNAVLLAALSAIYLLIRNVVGRARSGYALFEGTLAKESFGKKIVVLVTGHKFSLSELKDKWHIYPMEDIVPSENPDSVLQRKLMIVPKDEGRDEVLNRLSAAVEQGKISLKVWATPGLPMLIFVTIGFFASLFLGDIVWVLVSNLLG
jgi:archaeal preflagellin peptidase FlaK